MPPQTKGDTPRPKQCPLEPRPAPPLFGKGPLATQFVPNGPKRCPLTASGRHLGHGQSNLAPRLHHLPRSSAISLRDCAKRYEGVFFPQRRNARYGPTGCPIRSETAQRGPTTCFREQRACPPVLRTTGVSRSVNAAAVLGCKETRRKKPPPRAQPNQNNHRNESQR